MSNNPNLPKIEIKLKECCLTCEDFDAFGITGLGYLSCSTDERVIACGHMKVCWKYRAHSKNPGT